MLLNKSKWTKKEICVGITKNLIKKSKQPSLSSTLFQFNFLLFNIALNFSYSSGDRAAFIYHCKKKRSKTSNTGNGKMNRAEQTINE